MSAPAPKKPAPAAKKPQEVKTDHIRKGATVLGIFIAAVAVVVVIHGIVAPRHTKGPGGGGIMAATGKPAPAQQPTGETPAAFDKEIRSYRQAAAAAQGVMVDQTAASAPGAGATAAGGGVTGGAGETPAERRAAQEQADYIRQQLRQGMQLYTPSSGGALAPAPAAQPNGLSQSEVATRYARMNEQLADLARRQKAGQNQ